MPGRTPSRGGGSQGGPPSPDNAILDRFRLRNAPWGDVTMHDLFQQTAADLRAFVLEGVGQAPSLPAAVHEPAHLILTDVLQADLSLTKSSSTAVNKWTDDYTLKGEAKKILLACRTLCEAIAQEVLRGCGQRFANVPNLNDMINNHMRREAWGNSVMLELVETLDTSRKWTNRGAHADHPNPMPLEEYIENNMAVACRYAVALLRLMIQVVPQQGQGGGNGSGELSPQPNPRPSTPPHVPSPQGQGSGTPNRFQRPLSRLRNSTPVHNGTQAQSGTPGRNSTPMRYGTPGRNSTPMRYGTPGRNGTPGRVRPEHGVRVKNLPGQLANERALFALFQDALGNVLSVKVPNPGSGRFGFVNFSSHEDAVRAVSLMDQKRLHGKVIKVHLQNGPNSRPATPLPQRPSPAPIPGPSPGPQDRPASILDPTSVHRPRPTSPERFPRHQPRTDVPAPVSAPAPAHSHPQQRSPDPMRPSSAVVPPVPRTPPPVPAPAPVDPQPHTGSPLRPYPVVPHAPTPVVPHNIPPAPNPAAPESQPLHQPGITASGVYRMQPPNPSAPPIPAPPILEEVEPPNPFNQQPGESEEAYRMRLHELVNQPSPGSSPPRPAPAPSPVTPHPSPAPQPPACIICWSAPVEFGFKHERSIHNCACRNCAFRIGEGGSCPICRQRVEEVVRVFSTLPDPFPDCPEPTIPEPTIPEPQPKPLSLLGHAKEVNSLAFNPQGNLLASASNDRSVRIWSVDYQGAQEAVLSEGASVVDVAFSPDGTMCVTALEDTKLRVWDMASFQPTGVVFTGHETCVKSVAVANHRGAAVCVSGANTGSLMVWDLLTGGRQMRGALVPGHTSHVHCVTVSADGNTVVSSGYDKDIRVWDLATRTQRRTLRGHTGAPCQIFAVACSPAAASTICVSAGSDKTVCVWDFASGQPLHVFAGVHTNWVRAVAISADGTKCFSASSDKTLRIWDLVDYQLRETREGLHDREINAVAVARTGTVATASTDKTIKMW